MTCFSGEESRYLNGLSLIFFGLARQLLRGAAELGPSISRQLEFQPGDLGLGDERVLRHRGDDALQRGEIVGQIVSGDRHAGSGSDLQPFWACGSEWLRAEIRAHIRKKVQSNVVYRAQPVPYDWTPPGTPHGERAVVPPDVATFRVVTER
jgi:hypothetical protein